MEEHLATRDDISNRWSNIRSIFQGLADHFGRPGRRIAGVIRRYTAVIFGPGQTRGRRLRYAIGALTAIFGTVAVLILAYAILLIPFTPGISTLKRSKVERPSVVLSADGEVITRFLRVNREWVPLEEVSDHVVEALIATEDHRFYKHPGIDPIRILGAGLSTVLGERQGGSTLTQQLARNMFPDEIGRSVSLTRKLKEIVTAIKIELTYSKDEILEAYLNTVPFYFGAYGIEMAARTYFDKSADDLDVLESATLVGMLKGTYYYNPVRNPERALRRRNVALQQMVRRGFLDEEDYEEMQEAPIELRFERQEREPSRAPHFTEHLRIWLTEWADRRDYNIYRDSLVIYTTLDMDLQEIAERAVERQGAMLQTIAEVEWGRGPIRLVSENPAGYAGLHGSVEPFGHLWNSRPELERAFVRQTGAYRDAVGSGVDEGTAIDSLLALPNFRDSLRAEKTRLQVGFVAMDPETGQVKAWVGSRDFDNDQYDHVARARRQPGSTFKPFVYARALQEGYLPDDELVDQEVEIPLENGYVWRPQNAGETVSGQPMTVAEGLIYSKNTITAQLVHDVGARDVARLAQRMGVNRSELRPVPSIALGTSEVSLLEMVAGYSTFASLGTYREPLLITRIEDRHGNVIEEFEPRSRRVLSETIASAVVDMMRSVVDRGTGRRIRTTFGIRADVAGKTGTTQGGADGWFILMHPSLVAGSWVGFNDPRIRFRTDFWGQGGNNALLVVGDFFRQAIRNGALDITDAEFPPAPELDHRPSILVRIGRWIRDVAISVWNELFGPDDEDQPPQGETFVARPSNGSIQIDDSEAEADSLNRLERARHRLDTLFGAIYPPPDSSVTGGDLTADTSVLGAALAADTTEVGTAAPVDTSASL